MLADPRKAIYTLNDWFKKELKERNKELLILSNQHHLSCGCLINILSKSNTNYIEGDQFSNVSELYACARKYNGLVVSNDNKLDFFTRSYQKEDTADLYPFYELTEQDIWDILCFILPHYNEKENPNKDKGVNLLEWAYLQEERHQIISSEIDPTRTAVWQGYVHDQKELIAALYSREKNTRHKIRTNIIHPNLKSIPGIFQI